MKNSSLALGQLASAEIALAEIRYQIHPMEKLSKSKPGPPLFSTIRRNTMTTLEQLHIKLQTLYYDFEDFDTVIEPKQDTEMADYIAAQLSSLDDILATHLGF